ncbi:biotin/lipoate--protein ligase family protein [Methylobacterium iners]|uniref:BPL/LPL catalytic domain-containing protein n=1 Tax=Methylobacterium iners TaxID=418707 RepID=A0ABQ4RSW4_9HYPH|nr:biotin/lipoate--protein ligase family protein [Methylobacterium iners]GJD93289.1 hypothetical protein OCOJLMKI_0480 [Methylobacterium iners]
MRAQGDYGGRMVFSDSDEARLTLPPAFTGVVAQEPDDAFDHACRIAGPEAAGTLVWVRREDVLDVAVVLAPDEPLASARRALFAGMTALADAIGAHAPPEIPVLFAWPDTLTFNAARIGGARLGWPEGCGEDAVPDWLVFSAMLIASKRDAGDPGLTPDSASLEEEGFADVSQSALVESFARNLMKAFEVWREDGFDALANRYLAHLPPSDGGGRRHIEATGDGLIETESGVLRLPLLPCLTAMAWRDPATGKPRL